MKPQIIPLFVTVSLIGWVTACKKADQNKEHPPLEPANAKSTGVANSAKGVLLQANWPAGNRYVYRMDMDQHSTNRIPQLPKPIQQESVMSITYALSVLKEMTNGEKELEMEFLANKISVTTGDQPGLNFDSAEKATGDEIQNPLAAAFRRMIGSKLRVLVNTNGTGNTVLGLDEWRNDLAFEDAGPVGQALNQQLNAGFFRMLTDFGRGLLAKPVAVGETWPFKVEFPAGATGKIAVDAKVTFKGWETREQHSCAVLISQGTLKGTSGDDAGPIRKMTIDGGKVTGRTLFDPELGAVIDSTSDQSLHVKGEMPGLPGGNRAGKFTSDIRQKITVKLVKLEKSKG